MTKIMVCIFCKIEANDDLGYWSCSFCNDHDGIKETEWYGEEE